MERSELFGIYVIRYGNQNLACARTFESIVTEYIVTSIWYFHTVAN